MAGQIVKRPNYFTSQFLVADDFVAEQEYHRNLRESHNLEFHGWGVLGDIGLRVRETTPNSRVLTVTKGVAVDEQGRTLILAADNTNISIPTQRDTTTYLSMCFSATIHVL